MKPFKKYDPKTFKTKRLLCGLTMQELADICRINRQTVGNIEHGRVESGASVTLVGLALDIITEEKGLTELFEALEEGSLL